MTEAFEDFFVKAFVAKLAFKTPDKAVLHGFAASDIVPANRARGPFMHPDTCGYLARW